MIITQEQSKAMLEAAKPLVEWLRINAHPLCVIHVTTGVVELLESISGELTASFEPQ